MTLTFTEEEKKYLRVADSGKYRLTCDDGAPERIKKSLAFKFEQHKKWIEKTSGKGGEQDAGQTNRGRDR